MYTYQKSGIFEAPTDWIIIISYNVPIYKDGNIRVSSWAEEYTEKDLPSIENEW